MEKFVLAIDQGTTSSRAIIFNHSGEIVSKDQMEFTQIFPKPGWVEHNANEIWDTQLKVIKGALSKGKIDINQIDSIGITNQRETIVVWDKNTGEPICNALVWQDKRTSDYCNALKKENWEDYVVENTGLRLDPYFSGTKLRWILQNVDGALENAKAGNLLFGTIDTWLIYKLSGGKAHVTDFTNASRTLIYNIKDKQWDEKLCNLMEIPTSILPTVQNSSSDFCKTDEAVLGAKIPVCGVAGDQQAALFGQNCTEIGMVKNTYGTGCFMLMNIGNEFQVSKNGLLTTLICSADGSPEYGYEGSIFIAGAAIQWLRDGLKIISDASETTAKAEAIDNTDDVVVVPAFVGLGAPYWDSEARGAIFGLTRGTSDNHIVRATLESLAYQTRDVLEAMELDSGLKLTTLRVDGGATANNFMMQFQSDILGSTVERPQMTETTALGAAFLAGIKTGFWDKEEIKSVWKLDKAFKNDFSEQEKERKYGIWKKAVKRTMGWLSE